MVDLVMLKKIKLDQWDKHFGTVATVSDWEAYILK